MLYSLFKFGWEKTLSPVSKLIPSYVGILNPLLFVKEYKLFIEQGDISSNSESPKHGPEFLLQ